MRVFAAATTGVVCALAGVLLLFTEVSVGYGFALVVVAVLCGVLVAAELHRRPSRP